MTRIAFHTRGGDNYGWGHIVRTKLLAEALRESAPDIGLEAVVEGPDGVRKALADAMKVRAPTSADRLQPDEADRPDAIVIDLLDIDDHLMATLRPRAKKLIAFSDMGADIEAADLIVQPQTLDRSGRDARRLCGPDYFVLDRGFRAVPRPARRATEARKLLICLGGEAHGSAPERVANVLHSVSPGWDDIVWIVGHGLDAARREAITAGLPGVEVLEFVDNMPARLASADCALISGGFIKWEAACCGTPALIVALVEHQEVLGRDFARTGAARYLGRLDETPPAAIAAALGDLQYDSDERRRMGEAGQGLVDGHGAGRVAAAILRLASSPPRN